MTTDNSRKTVRYWWREVTMKDKSRRDKVILWTIRVTCLIVGVLVGHWQVMWSGVGR